MSTNQNGQLEFEDKLWLMADKLRNNIDAAEYKHVVLGLLFLKYISDAFEEQYEKLSKEEYADPEDRDEYTAQNIFWVPREARWSVLKTNAKKPHLVVFYGPILQPVAHINTVGYHSLEFLIVYEEAGALGYL